MRKKIYVFISNDLGHIWVPTSRPIMCKSNMSQKQRDQDSGNLDQIMKEERYSKPLENHHPKTCYVRRLIKPGMDC